MSGILRLESLTKGNTLKQGDLTLLKYRLFDADGDKLDISGKPATVRLMKNDFTLISYEKEGLTVAPDDTISFNINKILPGGLYHLEIIVDDKYIFPSRADEGKFNVDKSSLGAEITIIENAGIDAVVRKAVDLINEDPNLIIDEDKLISEIIANTSVGSIEEYYQEYRDVIKELSEDKDYHSLPEIAGARGGFDTLGDRLNDTTAQLAQKVGQGKKAELEDLSPTVLSAIEGGEGTSFNLLSIPQDKSVTEIKTTFINKSLNLFNADEQTIATIKDNHFMSGGVLYSDRPGHFVTAPIPVKSTTTYSVNEKIWGALGTAVAINTFSESGTYRNGHNTQTFTTPTNCAYIQISVVKTLYSLDWIKNNFMLVEGNVIPTNYQAPGFFLNDNIQSERILAEVLKTKDNPKPLFVHISGETLKVNAKYNDTQDVRFNLAKRGVNNIFDFVNAQLVVRPSSETTSDMTSVASTLWSTGTDTFGPHVIRAVNNPDGDNHLATAFTGGNHGYDGGGNTGQSATGRTAEIIFKVDGRKVQSFESYAANVEVIWTNYIQGNNTRKSDGTGREILKETIKLFYDGITWQVDYQSEMLEDVIYNTFYGLQLVTANYGGGIFYESSINKKWNINNNVASNSGDKKTSRFKVRDAAKINFVDVTIDKTIGLGMREYLSHDRAAFHTTNKAYMFLVSSDTNLSTGDILTYKGSFRFYALS